MGFRLAVCRCVVWLVLVLLALWFAAAKLIGLVNSVVYGRVLN